MTTASETDPGLVPLLAIEAFAGIRPAEGERISWEDIDFEDNVLTVPGAAAKTGRARHIEMHRALLAWLDWFRKDRIPSGLIAPAIGTPLRTRLRAVRKLAGIIPWPQDCLRHTFASASLASEWRDIGKLCLDLGHTSQAMLHRHYHRAMRRAEADAIFDVVPPVVPGNIVPMLAE